MKVYIAGKITGVSRHTVVQNFFKAKHNLSELGFVVFNPVEFIVDTTLPYEVMMDICFKYLEQADILYLLPNWKNSEGAMREYEKAKELGKIIIFWR